MPDRTLLSEKYRDQLLAMHTAGGFGDGTPDGGFIHQLTKFAAKNGLVTVLDFGCGQGQLAQAVAGVLKVSEFDPAIPGKDVLPPGPFDIVYSSDVLEHIEPTFLDTVLRTMTPLTQKCFFHVISTEPAKKTLPDGRNAHLIVRPGAWWRRKFERHIRIVHSVDANEHVLIIGAPL